MEGQAFTRSSSIPARLLGFCAVFSKMTISPYSEVETISRLLGVKLDFKLSRHVWHAPWNNVEWYSLAREVEQDKSSGRLLTFWAVFNDSIINPDWEVEMTWNLLGSKVDFIGFPTGTHGPLDLSEIKSYGCFFWWSELAGPIWLSELVRTGPNWLTWIGCLIAWCSNLLYVHA